MSVTYGRVAAPTNYANRNPFANRQMNELTQDYYAHNPQAVFGSYLSNYGTTGQNAVAPDFRRFVESWLPDMYKQYEGRIPFNPGLQFTSYLGSQDPYAAYQATNPYRRGLGASFRTRLLRR